MREDSSDSEEEGFDSEFENETASKSLTEEPKCMNLELLKSISSTLSTILEENNKKSNLNEIILKQSKMCFSAKSIPSVSIYDYLKRIQNYSLIEKNTLILSLIYIDRLCQLGKVILTYYNIHRIIFAAILISIKYNEDNFFDNKYYSEIAGIKLNELNLLEYTFMKLCNFKMFVSKDIFDKYNAYLLGKDESSDDEWFKWIIWFICIV